jgi:hypothetical protein
MDHEGLNLSTGGYYRGPEIYQKKNNFSHFFL